MSASSRPLEGRASLKGRYFRRQRELERLLVQARDALEEGCVDQTAELSDRIAAVQPDLLVDVSPWSFTPEGRRRLRALLRRQPSFALGYLLASYAARTHRAARDWLDRGVAVVPGCAWLRAQRGRFLFFAGEHGGAFSDLDQAVRLGRGIGWILAWRGHARARTGRLAEAHVDLSRAIRADPLFEASYRWRAAVLSGMGRYEEALTDLDVGLALVPGYAACLQERALVRHALGDYRGCAADLRKLQRLLPGKPLPYAFHGETLLHLSRPRDSLRALRMAAARGWQCCWLHRWRARAYERLGRLREAARQLRLVNRTCAYCPSVRVSKIFERCGEMLA